MNQIRHQKGILLGEVPLRETKGNQVLSKPKASIIILEATHFVDNKQLCTQGSYKVVELFNDNKIHFDGLEKVT